MAVHPHSSSETYIIYCVGQSKERNSAFVQAMELAGIPAKPLLGRYKGSNEKSYISRLSDFNAIEPWLGVEESILHIHSFDARDRPRATLHYRSTGDYIHLGRMVSVSKDQALLQDAFTFDPTYKQYFVCQLEPL